MFSKMEEQVAGLPTVAVCDPAEMSGKNGLGRLFTGKSRRHCPRSKKDPADPAEPYVVSWRAQEDSNL